MAAVKKDLEPEDVLPVTQREETAEEAAQILHAYQTGAQPPKKFTRGLWDRGVE